MAIIPSIINWLNTKRINQIELLRNILLKPRRKHFIDFLPKLPHQPNGAKNITIHQSVLVKEYQSRVPVQTYEEIIPYVERLRRGEQSSLAR